MGYIMTRGINLDRSLEFYFKIVKSGNFLLVDAF